MYGTVLISQEFCQGDLGTDLIVSNNIVREFLILECELDMIAFPVIVEELVGHFVLLLEAKLNSNKW
jgi:hypothetical protein